MSGSVSYVFYAIDKPLSHAERVQVARHDPDPEIQPQVPKTKRRLPPYLKRFGEMLKTSGDL